MEYLNKSTITYVKDTLKLDSQIIDIIKETNLVNINLQELRKIKKEDIWSDVEENSDLQNTQQFVYWYLEDNENR